ncbi:sensor histidine kinase [Streptomyces sp. NPDC059525]|uniref:sensor histidine kinase n=1 Tax=Streptomyces sp. NPDC059525 TaxID=3346857 RepID=UPI0036C31C76
MTVSVDGTARTLSPGTDLAAYRIIQEALTNVTKHAATGEAHVRLAYTGSRLRITFTNNGPARTTPATAPGYGIIGHIPGLRELRAGVVPRQLEAPVK